MCGLIEMMKVYIVGHFLITNIQLMLLTVPSCPLSNDHVVVIIPKY